MPQAIGTYTGASNNTSNTKTYTSNAGTSWDTTSTSLSNAVISTSLTANAPELTSAVPSSVSSPITSPARLSPSISVDLSSTVEDSEILYTTTIWSDEQPSEIDPAHPDDSELEDVEIVSCDTTEHETWFTGEETVTATATGGNFTAGGKGNGTVYPIPKPTPHDTPHDSVPGAKKGAAADTSTSLKGLFIIYLGVLPILLATSI